MGPIGSLEGNVNSLPGTTGPGVPNAMKQRLQELKIQIQEDADTFFGSAKAVEALEKECGWDPAQSCFQKPECFSKLNFDTSEAMLDVADPDLIDIVIPSIRNLDFLNQWQEFFQGFHVIIIQDGDPSKKLTVPDWVDYELYNRNDIQKALGDAEWIISSRDASIRNFGFLLSKKRYIYTIDDDCLPAQDQNGAKINPLALHLRNLRSPSIPYFFNTLYDPYVNGSDFVRGYPYSLRRGVPTAISHGIWLNAPDYDAPTQLLKPRERNQHFLDVTLTVPASQLYPMCSMNVAFDRALIGPAFMQGLMGDGQPWARYDDMFAGWASKVVADHLNVGVKSGQPYVRHNKASNPFTNLKKEWKGLWWQEQVISFLQNIRLSTKPAAGPAAAYVDLANQLEHQFSQLHPYFKRLAEAMRIWARVWQQAAEGQIQFVPSRQQSRSVPPINLHARENFVSQLTIQMKMLRADPTAKIVCDQDRALGRLWKTYAYKLPNKFHVDPLREYMSQHSDTSACIISGCNRTMPDKYMEYNAESIVLMKLLEALRFTENPFEADMILVPALPGTYMRRCGGFFGCDERVPACSSKWYDELRSLMPHFSNTKSKGSLPHLFLMSQDSYFPGRPWLQQLIFGNGHLLANYGPGNLVIPSLNVKASPISKVKSYEERSIFLLAQFHVRYKDRISAAAQLKAYNGSKTVWADLGRKRARPEAIRDSVFNLCLPGDLPYQKRFFDTLLAGAIPVVILREQNGIKVHYQINNRFKFTTNASRFAVEKSYPSMELFGGISKFIVEVPGQVFEAGGLMEFLEGIPPKTIHEKMALIRKHRMYFGYDFNGTGPDAVTEVLRHLAKWLGKSS